MAIDVFGILDTDCYMSKSVTVVQRVKMKDKSDNDLGWFEYNRDEQKAYNNDTKQFMGSEFSKMLRFLIDGGVKK